MKRSVRQLSSLFLAFTITTSLVVAALAPLFSAPLVAQTNPQSTDIFTGQFIPAYFGAAYDPSEAFKQMAGLPVYVFAYDTWGKVVNNFAYKTQIKADGSFQAAGLPNASHYGICFGVKDNDTNMYFRAPKPEDGIQSAFAYSQATFPNDAGTINTQTPNKQLDMSKMSDINNTPGNTDDDQGCRVYLTSSRQVDIANHINIFPLVPTSILSVIITDALAGSYDSFNTNSPYEIYAQRVVIDNTPSATFNDYLLNPCDSPACETERSQILSNNNAVAVGPVIRGRSIAYNPTAEDGSSLGSGTIFQAFAPRGVYAITYWRPDSRSSNAKMTYLSYDGLSSLDTPYNGIAIEEVLYPSSSNWKNLSTRSAKEDGGTTWIGKYGTTNAWGMATRGKNGKVVPQRDIILEINDPGVGFIDISRRACAEDGAGSYSTSNTGLYIVSSACDPENPGSSAPSQTGDISTYIRALNSAQSSSTDLIFSEQSGLDLQVTGRRGPARRDIPLNNIPEAYTGMLQRDGKPFAFAKIDLLVNGKRNSSVAQADSTGFFYIPTTYFNDNPYTKYEVRVSPSYNVPDFDSRFENTFALDNSKVLAAKNNKGADLGIIAINARQPNQAESFLAGLSLENFFKTLRFPTAYAQQKIGSYDEGEDIGKLEMSTDEPWKFEIDLEALGTARKYFNPANYHLKTVEINPPDEGLGVASGVRNAEYEYFTRNKEGEDVLDGAWLEGVAAEQSSLLIKGVQLKYEDSSTYDLAQRFKDLDTTYLSFNLRVRFEYQGGTTPQPTTDVNGQPIKTEGELVDDQQSSVGQTQGFPNVLEATWPVEVRAITDSGNIQEESITSYEVRYSPIVLDIESPNCGGGSLLKDGFSDVIQNMFCKLVIGGINGVKSVISFMADNFLTVDPLNYAGADIVIKYWNVIRNLVNSLAVLILLVAGIAIMLQYEPTTYNLQTVLKKLIIAIVLVNFSILLIQLAIDVANVLSQGGYYMLNDLTDSGSTGLANVNAAVGALSASLIAMLAAAVASGFTGFMAMFVFLAAILLLLLYVCYKVIVQYFFRMATLWICIILAPAAFAARVLPGTSSYFGKWKNVLVGTLVAQAALALMLGLSLAMIVGIKSAAGGTEAFILVIAAFVMLYMATKLPNKAAAMMGSDLAGSLESSAFAGLKSANTAWKASRIARRQRKFLTNERERTLGIDKEKRSENREAYESSLAALGKGRFKRFVGGRRFAAAQKLQASTAMTADGYNRNLREFKRVGRVDYLSGVRGSDLDHAEEEARKTADSQYIESRFAQLPHKDEAMRLQQIEKMIYEQADTTASIFSHGKLTDARKNLSLVDGRYGYNQHHLDANGNIRKDSLGRDIRLGDVSAPDTVYNKGLDEVFKKNRQYLKGDNLVKANAAIGDAKMYIGSSTDIADDYQSFFKGFSFNGKSDKDAWVEFYNATGEDISPDAAYADVMGKVYDDFVIRAADKGDTAWGASLKGAQSQAGNGGISERHRITVDPTDQVLSITHPSVVTVGASLVGGQQALHRNPTTPLNGRDLKAAQDAIKRIKLAYEEDRRGIAIGDPNSSLTSQLYKSAYQTLYNLGYRP